MDKIKETAHEILDIVKSIYEKQESENPTAIFGKKTFYIKNNNGREVIIPKWDYEKNYSSFYFESPEMDGVIIKKDDGNYCIKASVMYTNANNQKLWFAKIRIEEFDDRDMQIKGMWGGSWQSRDYHDEDLMSEPEFPYALDSLKEHLVEMNNELSENKVDSDCYDPGWVKKLKKYNTK
jgi:hypothetical protein